MHDRAATLPPLGAAGSFAVLGTSTVTNVGSSLVAGDLGVSPGTAVTGFPPGTVTGTTHTGVDSDAGPARADAIGAYDDAAGQACDTDLTGVDLGGMILTPGVFCFDTSAQLTGTLTLDFQGDSAAVFLFQIGSTLTTASEAGVVTVNGASSCDHIVWTVGTSATLGTATLFQGNFLALASITSTTATLINGSLFALNGAVTLDTNFIQACGSTVDAQCATNADCADDGNLCTDEICNPSGADADAAGCTHPDNTATCDDGLFCNGADTCSGGICDHSGDPCLGCEVCGDTCNETADNCLDPAGTTCRAAAGPCDVAEACTGSSMFCPPDGFLAVGTICRADAGDCDVAEACTGTSAACPADCFDARRGPRALPTTTFVPTIRATIRAPATTWTKRPPAMTEWPATTPKHVTVTSVVRPVYRCAATA